MTTQINITLGTAGHIDHGKTALVRLLTGCETDRLKEERERGMSIELGFAPCTIEDVEVGIVDVPGHEHFIRTMVAGAAGVDAVMRGVAADDGIMPQTREHLDIMTLLGIRHGIIALTKIDRVSPERVRQVSDDLRAFTRATFLRDAPILPISNVTGEGVDAFLGALKTLVHAVQPRSTEGVFRLPVERAFSVRGVGTVLSGIPVSGSIAVGDEVLLLPQKLASRVTAVQVYGRDAERACSGQCAAINVRHWDSKTISRGDTLAVPGYFEPASWFACTVGLLDVVHAPLKNGSEVRFHTGTSEVNASLYALEGNAIDPGPERFIQLRTAHPIVAGPNDRFILRSLSPPNTIGGGTILEPLPHRLKRTLPHLLDDLRDLAAALDEPAALLEYRLRTAPAHVTSLADLAVHTGNPQSRVRKLLDGLLASGAVLQLTGDSFIHAATARALQQRVTEILSDYHRSAPQSPGMTLDELLASSSLAKPVLSAMLRPLLDAGVVVQRSARFALSSHTETFTPDQQRHIDVVEPLFLARLFNPPSPEEVVAQTRLAAAVVRSTLDLLIQHQRLVPVARDMFFHRDAVDRAARLLADFITAEGQLESVKFKYLIDTTRKYALPLLDYFDKIGVTLRVGNTRYLKNR